MAEDECAVFSVVQGCIRVEVACIRIHAAVASKVTRTVVGCGLVVEVASVDIRTTFCIVGASAVVVRGHGIVVVGTHVGATSHFIHVTHTITIHICNAVAEAVIACCGCHAAAIVDGCVDIVVASVDVGATHVCAAREVTRTVIQSGIAIEVACQRVGASFHFVVETRGEITAAIVDRCALIVVAGCRHVAAEHLTRREFT